MFSSKDLIHGGFFFISWETPVVIKHMLFCMCAALFVCVQKHICPLTLFNIGFEAIRGCLTLLAVYFSCSAEDCTGLTLNKLFYLLSICIKVLFPHLDTSFHVYDGDPPPSLQKEGPLTLNSSQGVEYQ